MRENEGKVPESIVLNHVLIMAQQSLCPDTYEKFVYAYNELIDIRQLPNNKIDYDSIE
ncbi:MAG: hypothetical protein Q7J27_10905 [Syntrophales bacterium]|nr:hypothetical protein [Syntrophales bacterium]